jgi:DNA-binding transcriptional LysR family regulator
MLQGQFHHKRRKLFTETYLCMFSAEKTGLAPPISLDDYLRLPHVVTSLRPGRSARGIVDGVLDKLGLRRTVALTTPRFLTTPSLVARAPVIVTMQARLARRFAAEFGLSLSPLPLPVDLGEITMSLLWHASYDHDPAHTWLRELVIELAAEL